MKFVAVFLMEFCGIYFKLYFDIYNFEELQQY